MNASDVSPVDIDEGDHQAVAVMTLRDVFAAKAMAAFITEPVEGVREAMFFELNPDVCATIAASAYLMADAMVKARQL